MHHRLDAHPNRVSSATVKERRAPRPTTVAQPLLWTRTAPRPPPPCRRVDPPGPALGLSGPCILRADLRRRGLPHTTLHDRGDKMNGTGGSVPLGSVGRLAAAGVLLLGSLAVFGAVVIATSAQAPVKLTVNGVTVSGASVIASVGTGQHRSVLRSASVIVSVGTGHCVGQHRLQGISKNTFDCCLFDLLHCAVLFAATQYP